MPQSRKTHSQHLERINEALHQIHSQLAEPLEISSLAKTAFYSVHHFQRIFREITDESVHQYIRRSRLEWAANLLIFNPDSPVVEIASECGFKSNASFNHAFKAHFGYTPGAWRREGYNLKSRQLKRGWAAQPDNPHSEYYRAITENSGDLPEVIIRRLEPIRVAYIRHRGYDPAISECWRRLLSWAESQGIDPTEQRMLGLHHSNPDLVQFDECRYVACLTVPDSVYRSRGVGVMNVPGGLYACCRAEGVFGDLLYLMRDITQGWLPKSAYRALNIPSQAFYFDNHFINQSGRFKLELRLPITML
jgi:AraC family transcriptional regulator